jgi:hypothetical protein
VHAKLIRESFVLLMDFACLKGIEEGVAEVTSVLHIKEDGYHTQLFCLNV